MFVSFVSRTAPLAAVVLLAAAVAVDRLSGIAAQSGPPAPSNLTAVVDGSNVTLSWRGARAGLV
jgi:hypothetical protein